MLHIQLTPWPHSISFPFSSRVKNKEKNRQAGIKLRKATSPSRHKLLFHPLLLVRRLMISGGGNPIRGGAGEPGGCWWISEARRRGWSELRTGTVFNVISVLKTAYVASYAGESILCSRVCFNACQDFCKAGINNAGLSHVRRSEVQEERWDPNTIDCVVLIVLTSISRKWPQDQWKVCWSSVDSQ